MSAIKCLSDGDVTRLKTYINTRLLDHYNVYKAYRNRLMILFMLDCGLRVGELVQLRWNFVESEISSGNYVALPRGITKTRRERTVPITNDVIEALKALHNYLNTHILFKSNDYIFPSPRGLVHISTRSVHLTCSFICLQALSKHVHPHVLRHTYATRLMRVAPVRVVQSLLGHSRLSSTQVYTHPNSNDLFSAVQKIQ